MVGSIPVDQIGSHGELLSHVDVRLSNKEKDDLLLAALPGAVVETISGERVVRFGDQVILRKQVTHLGNPWPAFKKRIQIPRRWLDVHRQVTEARLRPRFVGIYQHGSVTIFVDFDPTTYVGRKANNSAAHVATNDLFQAQTLGAFSREDRNGNALTSVRPDKFADYLQGDEQPEPQQLQAFARFNADFLTGERLEALLAIGEMHEDKWPDRFQGEWPGFYLEYRFDRFSRTNALQAEVAFQKVKQRGGFDYDLVIERDSEDTYFGDLKASDVRSRESLGNDAEQIRKCIAQYGRFWYVIYEHDTWHGRDEDHEPTRAWNAWRRDVGHVNRKEYDPLSYSSRFKSAVAFKKMSILEVNQANFHLVLEEFNQGKQPNGAGRAPKVKITKKNIDNFLIYSASI